jgi:hypothetical protein
MAVPKDFLAWIIACTDGDFSAAACAEWLEGCLPRPVNELEQWLDQLD